MLRDQREMQPDGPQFFIRYQREELECEKIGTCQICLRHCPEMTKPQPARLQLLSCGRFACAMCCQFEQTLNAARRIRPNCSYYQTIMTTLMRMESEANQLIECEPEMEMQLIPRPLMTSAVRFDPPGPPREADGPRSSDIEISREALRRSREARLEHPAQRRNERFVWRTSA